MPGIRKNLEKIWKILLILLIAITFNWITLSSTFNQRMGNIFFGEFSSLYNVKLAQLFFEHSAYPFFGKPVLFAHYQLSRTYFVQGNLLEARVEADKELELYPTNRRTYYILGLTYGYMGQEQKAINSFGEFIEWQPTSWAARNDRAWLQFRIGDIDGALETMKPVVGQTMNPWIQNTYGTLLFNKKDYIAARQAFVYAKRAAESMNEKSWGAAYPGNDPRIYGIGLDAMKESISDNLRLLNKN